VKRAALFALLLLGCSRENALVDGECASGYVQSDDTCVLAPDGGLDGSNDGDATLSDASDASDDGRNRDAAGLCRRPFHPAITSISLLLSRHFVPTGKHESVAAIAIRHV